MHSAFGCGVSPSCHVYNMATIVPHDIYVRLRPHTKYPEGITALLGTFWFNQATAGVQYVKQEVAVAHLDSSSVTQLV